MPERKYVDLQGLELSKAGDTRGEEGQVELPPQFGVLCDTLNKLMGPVWTEWDGVLRGHVHVARREVATFEAYRDAVMTQVRELSDIVGTLGTVCKELVREALRGNPGVSADEVALAGKRYADLVRQMLRVRIKVFAISPPDGWEEMHAALLDAFDEQLLVAKGLHDDLLRIREDPSAAVDDGGAVRVHVNFDGPALVRLLPLWKETLERTRPAFGLTSTTNERTRPASGPSCAVVTACFGDEEASEVVCLRRWREAVLMPSRAGRGACRMYAATSPAVAKVFKLSPLLAWLGRAAVRGFLRCGLVVVSGEGGRSGQGDNADGGGE